MSSFSFKAGINKIIPKEINIIADRIRMCDSSNPNREVTKLKISPIIVSDPIKPRERNKGPFLDSEVELPAIKGSTGRTQGENAASVPAAKLVK